MASDEHRDSIAPATIRSRIPYNGSMRSFDESYSREIEAVLSAEVGIWIWHLTTGELQWNRAMCSIFELSEGQFDGQYLTWRKRVHPDDIKELENNAHRILETDDFLFVHYRIVTDSGKLKVLKNRARRIVDSDGKVVRMVGINIDITEAVRAKEDLAMTERTLHQAQQMTQMVMWEEDLLTGEIVLSSDLRETFELQKHRVRAEELLKFVVTEDIDRVVSARRNLIENRIPMDVEYRLNTPKGLRYRHTRAELFYDAHGKPVRIVGVTHDLTPRKRAEEDRLQLQQRLLQIEKLDSLGTFAGGIAHDFNNFLAAIAGQVEFALEQQKSAVEMQGVLKRVLGITHRAQSLVSRILTFSKVPQLHTESVFLSDLFGETFEILEASLPANIEFAIGFRGTDFGVNVDRIQLQQVLINILNNAVQAIGDRAGRIEVSSGVIAAADITGFPAQLSPGSMPVAEYAWLEIRDDGPGISESDLKRIFDPMFTTKSPQHGTGLGLSVSQSIAQAHGGWISVDSNGFKGASLKIFLPYAGKSRQQPAVAVANNVIPLNRDSFRVLLVDDDVEVLALLSEALGAQSEFNVMSFSDPLLAKAEFERDPKQWALVVTDLTMPGLNGLELCRSIHEHRPTLRAILMTGFDRSQVMSQIELDQRIHVLLKPFRIQVLRDLIHQLAEEQARAVPGSRRPGSQIA